MLSYNLSKYFFILCLYICEHLFLPEGKRKGFTRKVHLCPQKLLDVRSSSVSFPLSLSLEPCRPLFSKSSPYSDTTLLPILSPFSGDSLHFSIHASTYRVFPHPLKNKNNGEKNTKPSPQSPLPLISPLKPLSFSPLRTIVSISASSVLSLSLQPTVARLPSPLKHFLPRS